MKIILIIWVAFICCSNIHAEEIIKYKHVFGQRLEWSKVDEEDINELDSLFNAYMSIFSSNSVLMKERQWKQVYRQGIFNELPCNFLLDIESYTFNIHSVFYDDDCSKMFFKGYENQERANETFIQFFLSQKDIVHIKNTIKKNEVRILSKNMKQERTEVFLHYKGIKKLVGSIEGCFYNRIESLMKRIMEEQDDIISFRLNKYSILQPSYHKKHDTLYEINYDGNVCWHHLNKVEISRDNKFLLDNDAQSIYLGIKIGNGYLYIELNATNDWKKELLYEIKNSITTATTPLLQRIELDENNDIGCIARWWKNDTIVYSLVLPEQTIYREFNDLASRLYIAQYDENLYFPHKKLHQYSSLIYSEYRKDGCVEIIFPVGKSNLGIQGLLIPDNRHRSIYGIYEENVIGGIHLYCESAGQREYINSFLRFIRNKGSVLSADYKWEWQNYIRTVGNNYIPTTIPVNFVKDGTYRSWEDLMFPNDSLLGTYIYQIKKGYIKSIKRTGSLHAITKLNEILLQTPSDTIATVSYIENLTRILEGDYMLVYFKDGIKIDSSFIAFGFLLDKHYDFLIPFDYKARSYHNRIYYLAEKMKKYWMDRIEMAMKGATDSDPIPHPERHHPIPFLYEPPFHMPEEIDEYWEVDKIWQKHNITPMPLPKKQLIQ